MDTNYADKKENDGYTLLSNFNKLLKLNELGRTPQKTTYDASGYTSIGDEVEIEIKIRDFNVLNDMTLSGNTNGKSYTADTIYIESHKIADMLLDYVCDGKIPLYINFMNDGYIYVYNISKLKHRPQKQCKRIYSKLYQGFELGKRQALSLDDAYIYKNENDTYKLIRRPIL